jgi:acetyl-CoA synthetase
MLFTAGQWFKGGKTNICYNAVDRNVEAGNGDNIAMYWEGNEPGQDGKLTYSELLDKVCQVMQAHTWWFCYKIRF